MDDIWLNDSDFLRYIQNISVNMYLESSGISVLYKVMLEKPEIAGNTQLEEKVKEYNELKSYLESNKADMLTSEEYQEKYSKYAGLIIEIQEEFMESMILNSQIELCADSEELYTEVPQIYGENKNNTENNVKNEEQEADRRANLEKNREEYNKFFENLNEDIFLKDFENYHPESDEIKISAEEARQIAVYGFEESKARIAGEGADDVDSETVQIEEVFANNYFTRLYQEYDKMYQEISRNCYVVRRENDMGNGIKIYVDATTGLIIGGAAFGD